ncbi:MAG: hypothetical protein D6753_10225 [Planctomycetota bacterium]|nr:MAG: hypothetical protein D6753_10225 [Planctomycetota bacterium]
MEATYLAPLYDVAPTTFQLSDGGATTLTTGAAFDSAEQITGAPRITLGTELGRGYGIQGRYWELTSTSSQFNAPTPILGNQLQSLGGEDSFNAYTIDLELTKEFYRRNWDLLGTVGVRHASLDHGHTASAYGVMNNDGYFLSASNGEEFHGTGLTFSLSGIRDIRPCRGLAAYWTTRGSTIFGTAETSALTSANVSSGFGNAGSTNAAIDQQDETLFIGEFGAGLQWSRCVRSFNGRFFARTGVEYQWWDAEDGSATAQSAAGILGNSVGVATTNGAELETQFIGLSVMTGFAW